ncbi:MAG: HlyD family efflux transporter periplasmic adaptor subunit, partial [Butyrivibrio sp.]|uniref:efflux RND transporter periplasmic adaptor subunit n=1 Tax=Butyrivibrio sp. TaxID=28121 RepID=UPI001B191AC4
SKNLEIEEVYVTMGQRITEGEALFKLTEASVASVKRLLESNQADAKIALAEAEQEYNIGVLEAENTETETNVSAGNAGKLYNATVQELQAQITIYTGDIEALTAEIAALEEDLQDEELLESLDEAYLELVAATNIFNDTDVQNFGAYTANKQEMEEAQSAYDKIYDEIESMKDQIEEDKDQIADDQTALLQAQEALAVQKAEADNTYKSTTLNGELSDDVYSYSANTLEETMTEAQNDLDEANEELEAFNSFVGDDGIIYANGSGIVTAVNYEAGDELEETGAMVTYTQEDDFTVSIDISEEDIKSVSVGDSVTLKFSAYEDESWEGEVSAITTTVSDNHSTTVSYPVTIDILGDTSKLYGGMTADVTFVTDSVSDVLYVSEQAIVYEDEKTYVYVQSGNDYEKKKITTGFSNGSVTEVTEGLSEGDSVYIQSKVSASQKELMDTTQTDISGMESSGGANGDAKGTQTQGGDKDSGSDMPLGNGNMQGQGGMPGGNMMPGGSR